MKTSKLNFKAILFIPVTYLLFEERCFGAKLQRCKGKFTMNRFVNISIFVETMRAQSRKL